MGSCAAQHQPKIWMVLLRARGTWKQRNVLYCHYLYITMNKSQISWCPSVQLRALPSASRHQTWPRPALTWTKRVQHPVNDFCANSTNSTGQGAQNACAPRRFLEAGGWVGPFAPTPHCTHSPQRIGCHEKHFQAALRAAWQRFLGRLPQLLAQALKDRGHVFLRDLVAIVQVHQRFLQKPAEQEEPVKTRTCKRRAQGAEELFCYVNPICMV